MTSRVMRLPWITQPPEVDRASVVLGYAYVGLDCLLDCEHLRAIRRAGAGTSP
jgi:hypothetical protein